MTKKEPITFLLKDKNYKILKPFFDNPNSSFYVNQLKKITKLSPKILIDELKNFEKAVPAYAEYLSTSPVNPGQTYYRLGLCQVEIAKYEEAVASFLEALKETPQDVRLNSHLAETYQKAKMYDKAEEAYITLSQLSPKNAKVYFR